MSTKIGDGTVRRRHEGLLHDSGHRHRAAVDGWVRAARERDDKVLALATLGHDEDAYGIEAVLDPATLDPGLDPCESLEDQVHRALFEGRDGLGFVVRADDVISATSAQFHSAIENSLQQLCRRHPVSVLCVYDRSRGGAVDVDMSVVHHPEMLYGTDCTFRTDAGTLWLSGEIDADNVDVLSAVLEADARSEGARLRIDLSELTFLSAAAVSCLVRHSRAVRQRGEAIELVRPQPQVQRVLDLIQGLAES